MASSGLRIARFREFRRDSNGQAQVEFALSILFVLLLILGIIELILLIYTYNTLADAAKEGVRYAIVHGCDFDSSNCSGTCATACTDTTGSNVVAWAKNFASASLHDTSQMTINVDYNPGGANGSSACSDAGCAVRVTVSYPYQPFFGFSWPTVTVRAAAEGRIVY